MTEVSSGDTTWEALPRPQKAKRIASRFWFCVRSFLILICSRLGLWWVPSCPPVKQDPRGGIKVCSCC